MKAEEYIKILTEQIRCRRARDSVADEVRGHIEDQKEEFIRQGMAQEEAEAAAVKEMGDPVEAGSALDQVHRPQMAWGMIGLIGVLSLVGFLILYLFQRQVPEAVFLPGAIGRQLLWMGVGFGVMIGVCFFDYSRIGMYAKQITIGLCVLLLLGKLFWGRTVNGSLGWICIGRISISLQMTALLFVPLYAAVLYAFRGEGRKVLFKGIVWMLPAFLILPQGIGLVTRMILLLTFLLIFGAAVYKNWFQIPRKKTLSAIGGLLVLLPALAAFLLWQFGAEYQKMRLLAILHPEKYEGAYTIRMLRGMLRQSTLIGRGTDWLTSEQLLPASGDYVLAYIAACYGILAAVVLAGLLAFLLLHFLKVSLGQKNQLGMLMGAGCAAVLFLQFLFYLGGNLGLIPSGVYCPFFTGGRSGMLVTYILLGIMLSIYRYQNIISETAAVRAPWRIRILIER
ncbi:MAG TPA: FtsW/RodA/SpoVE family cell cycle protein [Lachnospiraceae bacterium]|nr:FtsW/RodA/SpoVE family cell cycle protein [Lachnospiraceae bacterium]